MNGWTSKQVDCEERQSNEGSRQGDEWTSKRVDCEGRQSNKGTSGQGDELTSEQVDCEERQNNRGTGVSTYNIWGEKGLKKSKRLIHFLQEEFSFHLLSLLTLQVITL